MRNLFIVCAFMFTALSFGQMSFSLDNTVDVTSPMNTTTANIGWFMNDDILVSFGMTDWDEFNVGARYYTGFCDNMFIEARTNATPTMVDVMEGRVVVDPATGVETPVLDPDGNQMMDNVLDVDGNNVQERTGGSDYSIGMAVGWTKSLGIWKLQFEPRIALRDVQDFTPTLEWALRFNL
tara:strand:- start:2 stop:541 length:540 start_codon:yes stop_codon:yes gene_type:complete